MRLIDSLKAKYPTKGFQMDPVSAVISFTHEDFSITDPFVTECGRFECLPTMEYHITMEDAIALFDHNLPLKATYSSGHCEPLKVGRLS